MATRTERRRAAVERRREFARRSVKAQVAARRRRSRIRWSAAAAGVAVLGAGAIVLIATRDDGGIPNVTLTGKKVDADGALGITAPLSAYTIDYDVTSYGSDPENPTKSTETIRASRPFGAKVTLTGESGAQSYTTVLGKGESAVPGATAEDPPTTTVDVIPAASGIYDWRLDASLDDLVASGDFTMKERREVAGRECQVYRTGSAPESATVAAPTDTDYTDMCIDASGLILEQVDYISGVPNRHLKATAVSEEPVDDIAVDGESADTTTSFTAIGTDAAPVEGYWSLSTVPEGYELVGRYAYVVPGQAPDDSTTATTVPVDTTAAPTATTAAPDTTVTDSTVPDSAVTESSAADTTVAAASPESTSAAQGFAGSNVLTALASTATTVAPAPAEETTTTVPAESTTTTTAAPAAPPVTTYFDVYRNGDDYLIVHQGPSAEAPTASGATSEATIGALGSVTTNSSYEGSMILAHPAAPTDWFVSISGSVDMATLTTIAGTLAQPAS